MRTLFAVLIALLSFSALNVHGEESPSLTIGAVIPLTGNLAHVGEDIRRGLEMGIDEFGASLKVRVIAEDSQHELKRAASAAAKLAEQDKVNVLISLWDTADVVAPIAERSKIPHIAIRWNHHIAEKYKYTFTIESTYRSFTEAQAALLKVLGVKKIGLLTEEAQGWVLADDYWRQISGKNSIEIVGAERLSRENTDYRSIIVRLLHKKPEMIVLGTNPPLTDLTIKQLRQLAPMQRVTGYFSLIQDPKLVEGLPFVDQFESEGWFAEKFRQRYGSAFTSRAPHAYDIIKVLSYAVTNQNGRTNGESLVKGIESMPQMPGALGVIKVSSRHTIESECAFKIWKNGSMQTLKLEELKSGLSSNSLVPFQ